MSEGNDKMGWIKNFTLDSYRLILIKFKLLMRLFNSEYFVLNSIFSKII